MVLDKASFTVFFLAFSIFLAFQTSFVQAIAISYIGSSGVQFCGPFSNETQSGGSLSASVNITGDCNLYFCETGNNGPGLQSYSYSPDLAGNYGNIGHQIGTLCTASSSTPNMYLAGFGIEAPGNEIIFYFNQSNSSIGTSIEYSIDSANESAVIMSVCDATNCSNGVVIPSGCTSQLNVSSTNANDSVYIATCNQTVGNYAVNVTPATANESALGIYIFQPIGQGGSTSSFPSLSYSYLQSSCPNVVDNNFATLESNEV